MNLGDLYLATFAWLGGFSKLHGTVIKKVETRDRIIRFWGSRFFFDRQYAIVVIKLNDTIALWVSDLLTKDYTATPELGCLYNLLLKITTIKDIVAQYQRRRRNWA